MAESRNILLIEDISSCDEFCYHDGSELKVRNKYTFHANRLEENSNPTAFRPDPRSVPAIDPITYQFGYESPQYSTILMSDLSTIIEVWNDVTIYWGYLCPQNVWFKIHESINVINEDSLVPQTTLPFGYIHTDIVGNTQDVLFRFETTTDVDGCTLLELRDGEDELISTFRQTDATCPTQVPSCTNFVMNGSCDGWESVDLAPIANCSGDPHKFTLEDHDSNLLVVIDDQGLANVKIKDILISGPFEFSYRVTCEDGEYCISTITVQHTPAVALGVEDFNVTINDIVATGSVADSDTPCDQGITRFHILQQAANGIVTMDIYGNYVYQPNAGFFGTDSFEYSIECCGCCQDHPVTSSSANIEVLEVSIDPALFSGCQNQVVAVDPAASISCVGGTLAFELEREPVWGGTLSILGTPLNVGDTFNEGDIIDYTPALDFCGVDAFTFSVTCDLGSGPISIGNSAGFIQIQCLSIVPGAIAVGFESTNNQGDVGIMPGCEYYVLDGAVRVPAGTPFYTGNGTVTMALDGTFTYVPDLGFEGPDQFSYEVDCAGCTEQSVVDINVIGPQFTCIGVADTLGLDGYTTTGDVSDITCQPPEEGFITTYEVLPASLVGLSNVTLNPANGQFTITKDAATCTSTWSFQWRLLCDGDECAVQTVSGLCFECGAEDDPGSLSSGNVSTNDTACSFGVTTYENPSNFVNVDSVNLNANSGAYTLQYTPTCAVEPWSFTYDILCNGHPCDTATVSGICGCTNGAIDLTDKCLNDTAQLDIINPCENIPVSATDVYIIPGSLVGLTDVTITSVDIRQSGLEIDDFTYDATLDPATCSGNWSFEYGYLCNGVLCSTGTISGTCCTEDTSFSVAQITDFPDCGNPPLQAGDTYHFAGESIIVDLPDCDINTFFCSPTCSIEVDNAVLVQVITPLPSCSINDTGAVVQVEIQPIAAGPFWVRLYKVCGFRNCESRFDGIAIDRLGCYNLTTAPNPFTFTGSYFGYPFIGGGDPNCTGCPDETCPYPVTISLDVETPACGGDVDGNCYRFEFTDGSSRVECITTPGPGPEIQFESCYDPNGPRLENIVSLDTPCDDIPVDCDMSCETAFCSGQGCTNYCGEPCIWCQDACEIQTEAFTGNETGVVIDDVGPFICDVTYNWGFNALFQPDQVQFIGSASGVLDDSGCINGDVGGSFTLPAGETLTVFVTGNCAGGTDTTWGLAISCECYVSYFFDRFATGTTPRWHYICSNGDGGPAHFYWCKDRSTEIRGGTPPNQWVDWTDFYVGCAPSIFSDEIYNGVRQRAGRPELDFDPVTGELICPSGSEPALIPEASACCGEVYTCKPTPFRENLDPVPCGNPLGTTYCDAFRQECCGGVCISRNYYCSECDPGQERCPDDVCRDIGDCCGPGEDHCGYDCFPAPCTPICEPDPPGCPPPGPSPSPSGG